MVSSGLLTWSADTIGWLPTFAQSRADWTAMSPSISKPPTVVAACACWKPTAVVKPTTARVVREMTERQSFEPFTTNRLHAFGVPGTDHRCIRAIEGLPLECGH